MKREEKGWGVMSMEGESRKVKGERWKGNTENGKGAQGGKEKAESGREEPKKQRPKLEGKGELEGGVLKSFGWWYVDWQWEWEWEFDRVTEWQEWRVREEGIGFQVRFWVITRNPK